VIPVTNQESWWVSQIKLFLAWIISGISGFPRISLSLSGKTFSGSSFPGQDRKSLMSGMTSQHSLAGDGNNS
jgi:hypothetical protein